MVQDMQRIYGTRKLQALEMGQENGSGGGNGTASGEGWHKKKVIKHGKLKKILSCFLFYCIEIYYFDEMPSAYKMCSMNNEHCVWLNANG